MTTETRSQTLSDALPAEQRRVRALLAEYQRIGVAGMFGAAMIEQALRRAEQAAAAQDTVAMLRSYEELRGME